jgi:regulator of protease activity HflC (stomatin/prohibitin superfamily)
MRSNKQKIKQSKGRRMSPNFPSSTGSVVNPRKIFGLGAVAILAIVLIFASFNIFESNDADEIMVVQSLSGDLTWHMTPGNFKWQGFGKVTKYQKRSQFWFSEKDDQGTEMNQAISVRFNDGGHGSVSGSIAWEMPVDEQHLVMLHTKYGSQQAIEQQLVRTIVEKSVYMTGPLMSSKESYAERRNELIRFIEDQIENGVYKTRSYQVQDKDPLSGSPRTLTVVDVLKGKDGTFERQDESPLAVFGVKTFNLSINNVGYDENVEKQIQAQQQAIMQIQTASAKAREAEQQAITAEQNGRAEAAKAKWEQEVIKAKMVTEAQQKLEVATLETKTAGQYKQKRILEAEADAEYKRKIIIADGALTQKLETYQAVMTAFAENIGKQKWVPDVIFEGSGAGKGSYNSATALIDMLSVKTAKDLALDLSIPKK